MSEEAQRTQQRLVIEQFSRQAVPFTCISGHLNGIGSIMSLSSPSEEDEVLDVACGPGLVACRFAPLVRRVEGIDMTPAMIDEALKRQHEFGLKNLSWTVGPADPLPYGDGRFSLVVTRYSFHHFSDPWQVFAEMLRVCGRGGRVVLADVVVPECKGAAFDRMERMRDPSHTGALREGDAERQFLKAELLDLKTTTYSVDVELEEQLEASFPEPGDKEKLRMMIREDIGADALGVNARAVDGKVWISYPVSVFAGRKR